MIMSVFFEKQKELKEKLAKDAIYTAAIQVITHKGIENLKMNEIADSAGIATGTLYNYFDNKEHLLRYINRRIHDELLEIMCFVAAEEMRADRKLKKIIREMFLFCHNHHIVYDITERLGMTDKIPIDEKSEALSRALACFDKIISDGIKQKVFRKVNARLTSKTAFFSVIGILEGMDYMVDDQPQQYINDVIRFLQSYLKVKKNNI